MKFSTFAFLVGSQFLLLCANANEEYLPPLKTSQNERVETKSNLRGLQLENFPDDDPYINPNGIMERKPCVEFDRLSASQLEDPWEAGDAECLTNSCDGGCCRAYNWLLCDTNSDYAYVPCVCNDNTWDPEEWTKAPTVMRPTPPPAPTTPPPVAAPTQAPLNPDLPDIVDTAIAAGTFTTLVDLVSTAFLVSTLQSPGPFTVFAPSDQTFAAAIPDLEAFKNATSMEDLTAILTYHVVPGVIRSTDLMDGASVPTVQGASLSISTTMGPMVNDAQILTADIETSNGIIHVVDSILMPPPDIVETAIAAGSFTTLVDLVATAGLVETLQSPGPFTVFAPTDQAFAAAIPDLEAFKSETSVEDIASILTYHVVPGRIRSTDLVDGAQVTTVQGETVTISTSMGPMVNNANVITPDIETSNGIVHVIDAVLLPPPPLPDIVDTAIAAGSFTTLVALVSAAGLVETLKGAGPFTVFAPSDAAFGFTGDSEEAAEFISETSLEDLQGILTYHVVPGVVIRSTDLVDGAEVETVQGDDLEISLSDDGAMVNDINIVAADVEASNGIIHVLDGILMP